MPRPPSNKRARVLHAATQSIYARGFHKTSLADIARSAGVPVGSVYYFFKAKSDLGRAVIEEHQARYREKCEQWDALPAPTQRLLAFLDMTIQNRDNLAAMGCPVGTLCSELGKEDPTLGADAAVVFAGLLDWLEAQFSALGHSDTAREHAEHLLGAIEGATLLTHSFRDPSYVEREAARLTHYIQEL